MARFEFRLAAVLALRRNAREQRRGELAAALVREREFAECRAALEVELEQRHDSVRAAQAGTIDVEQLRVAGEYEAALLARRAQVEGVQRAAADEVERCRAALAAAEGQLRILENLRERQQEALRRNELQAEARQADEWAGRTAAVQAAGSRRAVTINGMARGG